MGARLVIGFATLALWVGSALADAGVEVLESPALRLEVQTQPYAYRLTEKAGGGTLVQHTGCVVRVGARQLPVTAARRIESEPDRLRLALTLDGGDAPMTAEMRFVEPGVLTVNLAVEAPGEGAALIERFAAGDEHYYGVWEQPETGELDNRGAERPCIGFGRVGDANFANARAPFYMTSAGYGVYVQTLEVPVFRFAVDGTSGFEVPGSAATYYVLYGPGYGDILLRRNALIEPAFLPPLWALDSFWWRDDHHQGQSRAGAGNAQELVLADAEAIAEHRIHAGAIWLDRPFGTGDHGWGNMDFDQSFPDPAAMVRRLDEKGLALLVWVTNRCSARLHEEGEHREFLFGDRDWPAADLRIPAAYEWFQEALDAFVQLGVRGYKIDRGHEGEMPEAVENTNVYLFTKLTTEGMRRKWGEDCFVFARNAYDNSRQYVAVWSGDPRASFGGLRVSVQHGLRSGLIGFPMWGSDVGGYIGNPSKELFARWLQFGAYSPFMEVLIGPGRTVWLDYDDELVAIARDCAAEHHDLIPYTRSCLHEAIRTGMPVMRALMLAHPDDPRVANLWDAYLYGPALLVAPVLEDKTRARQVYLPEGRWLERDTDTVHAGPAEVEVAAPLERIPVFIREGAIVPRGDIVRSNNDWTPDWRPSLRIEVYPSPRVAGRFEYFTGSVAQPITCEAEADGAFAIAMGDLGVPGVLEIRCRGVRSVARNGQELSAGGGYTFDADARVLRVPFEGAATVRVACESLFD